MDGSFKIRMVAWSVLGSAVAALSIGAGSCADPEPAAAPERVGEVQQAGAATGVCDSNPPTTTQACIDAVQASANVVNGVFLDVNGLNAHQLPVYGTLFQNWPGCDQTSFAGCAGQSNPPYDCPTPTSYTCLALTPPVNTFANASAHLNALDHLWWHPERINDHTAPAPCPNYAAIVQNGEVGHYFPWEGLVFDLGGPSNKVAIFAQNDHGPQPCESLEYTVYLTDNPLSTQQIFNPAADGVDPQQWNRAVLTTIFTWGHDSVRAAEPGTVFGQGCGDTVDYAVEDDSFSQVFSLPCGITFRYAAIIAGNDGLDFPECAFDSNEAELDAIAGLTETGAGVCPDDDEDHYVDCACPGAPVLCDCDDTNENINPGEPEPCDSVDVNCDMLPGSCPTDSVCYQSICLSTCMDESASCPQGSECEVTSEGTLCVPVDCTSGGCPAGSVCENGQCVPACTGVVCPGDQICQDGQCIDPCEGVACPPPLVCQLAVCVPPCACYQGDAGCVDLPGTVCDEGNTDLCVPPLCQGVVCTGSQSCDPLTGNCVDFCHPGVICPQGQKCVDPDGCVPLCSDVVCDPGFECDPDTGECVDVLCQDVSCFPPLVCVEGECVDTSGSGGAGGNGAGGEGGLNAQSVVEAESGCSCRTAGASHSRGWWLLFAACLLARRRREV